MTEGAALVLPEQAGGAVAPVRVEALVEMVDAFEKFKSMVLREGDFWLDRKENKRRVRKSGWLKYALACNVSLGKVGERSEMLRLPGLDEPVLTFHFDYRAVAPSGRYAEASGSASVNEREKSEKIAHDTRALAQTRAMNRAISNLVGGGEVSAEEMEGTVPESTRPIAAGQAKGVCSLEELERVLGEHILDLKGTVKMLEREEGFVVEKVRHLDDDEWNMINGWIVALDGKWVSAGPRSRWAIPRGKKVVEA